MPKLKYSGEFELHVSAKMLYPYLSTASGLQEWFADEVNNLKTKELQFIWNKTEEQQAKIVVQRTNKQIKFEFLEEGEEKSSYLEFKLEENELTNSTFLKITDFSEMTDEAESEDLWQGLVAQLKELLGA